jgi:hypothetical protein
VFVEGLEEAVERDGPVGDDRPFIGEEGQSATQPEQRDECPDRGDDDEDIGGIRPAPVGPCERADAGDLRGGCGSAGL